MRLLKIDFIKENDSKIYRTCKCFLQAYNSDIITVKHFECTTRFMTSRFIVAGGFPAKAQNSPGVCIGDQ